MSIRAECPACGASTSAPDHAAGKKAKCPTCGSGFVIADVPRRPSPMPMIRFAMQASFGILMASLLLVLVLRTERVEVTKTVSPPAESDAWEYRVISPPDLGLETELNKLGSDGWDVVSARRALVGGNVMAYELIIKKRKRG